MHRVLREQKRCRELADARRYAAYLEERLDAAEAELQDQDKEIEALVEACTAVKSAAMTSVPSEGTGPFWTAMNSLNRVLLRYRGIVPQQVHARAGRGD